MVVLNVESYSKQLNKDCHMTIFFNGWTKKGIQMLN